MSARKVRFRLLVKRGHLYYDEEVEATGEEGQPPDRIRRLRTHGVYKRCDRRDHDRVTYTSEDFRSVYLRRIK